MRLESSISRKKKKFFNLGAGNSHLRKYKKIFRGGYFLFLQAWKVSFWKVLFSEIWEKFFYWENIRNFFRLSFLGKNVRNLFRELNLRAEAGKYKKLFNLRDRKLHLMKCKKKFFWGIFLFFELGLKSAPGSYIMYYSN